MSIHNTIEVVLEEELESSHTRDRFGRKHKVTGKEDGTQSKVS